jgi:hypothetical protein
MWGQALESSNFLCRFTRLVVLHAMTSCRKSAVYRLVLLTTLLNMGELSASSVASLPARPGTLCAGGSEVPRASLSLLRKTGSCFLHRESNHISLVVQRVMAAPCRSVSCVYMFVSASLSVKNNTLKTSVYLYLAHLG